MWKIPVQSDKQYFLKQVFFDESGRFIDETTSEAPNDPI